MYYLETCVLEKLKQDRFGHKIVHIFSLFVRKKGPHNYAQLIWKGTWKYFMMKITMYLDLCIDEKIYGFGFAYVSVTCNFVLGLSDTKNPCSLLSINRSGTTETLPEMNQSFLDEVELADVEEIVFQSDDDGESIQGWL